jgi:phosphatidylglycerophosphatase C
MTEKKTLVLFDFDGTLTRGDTLLPFLWHSTSFGKIVLGCLKLISHYLWLIFSGQWSRDRAKETLFAVFFQGAPEVHLKALGETFVRDYLPRLLLPRSMAVLKQHRESSAQVVVVSASCGVWLKPFCLVHGLDLLCTELEYREGVFTGKFATKNCIGTEKVRRIQAAFDVKNYTNMLAYGNSTGDLPMLALADEAWWVDGNSITPLKME